jgi:YHS domain-containing protein
MRLIADLLTFAALSVTSAEAQQPVHINVDLEGLALHGYDVVAYFTDRQATLGKAELTATHDGGTYRFASAEHRAAFLADPEKYLPRYGGFCAYGVANGYKVKIDRRPGTSPTGSVPELRQGSQAVAAGHQLPRESGT